MRCLGGSELLKLRWEQGIPWNSLHFMAEDDGHLFLSKSKSFLYCNGHLMLESIVGLVRREIQTVEAVKLLVDVDR